MGSSWDRSYRLILHTLINISLAIILVLCLFPYRDQAVLAKTQAHTPLPSIQIPQSDNATGDISDAAVADDDTSPEQAEPSGSSDNVTSTPLEEEPEDELADRQEPIFSA